MLTFPFTIFRTRKLTSLKRSLLKKNLVLSLMVGRVICKFSSVRDMIAACGLGNRDSSLQFARQRSFQIVGTRREDGLWQLFKI